MTRRALLALALAAGAVAAACAPITATVGGTLPGGLALFPR
ncbi:MAG: hypothetical protein U0838_03000 [Chloroflexota bacterium]